MKPTSFGTDPEFHLWDEKLGRIVSSMPVLPNKTYPVDLGDGIRTYSDNVLVEAAMPPSDSAFGIVDTIRLALKKMLHHLTDRYSLIAQASHVYLAEELKPYTHPTLLNGEGKPLVMDPWESGCNPNSDSYTGAQNKPANFNSGLRTGSFHIHVGHEELKPMSVKLDAIKLLDIYVGCPMVIADKDPTSLARRALYGRAGEYRPTPYGVEWRILGNYPLRSSELTLLVFELVEYTMGLIHRKESIDILRSSDFLKTQKAINTCDRDLAIEVLEAHGMPWRFLKRITETRTMPSDIRDGWGL